MKNLSNINFNVHDFVNCAGYLGVILTFPRQVFGYAQHVSFSQVTLMTVQLLTMSSEFSKMVTWPVSFKNPISSLLFTLSSVVLKK